MTGTAAPNTASGTDLDPPRTTRERGPRAMIRKLNIAGLTMVVVFVGCIGGWAATSELAGAVIAAGTVIVESVDKKVQHPTGGVVKEILVQDGSAVEEGQILVRLDDTLPRATLGVLRSQLDENNARHARLLAEREGAGPIAFPEDLVARKAEVTVSEAMNGEQKLFEFAQGRACRSTFPVARAHRAGQRGNPRARRSTTGQGGRDQAHR